MLKILFTGDAIGRIGRVALAKAIPKLKKKHHPDLIISNVENIAHGSGVTESTLKDIVEAGVDYMTTGDHAFKAGNFDVYEKFPIIRPANYAKDVPGKGFTIITINNKNILLINLIGRIFMKMDHDDPFLKIDEILANPLLSEKKMSAIIVDVHAEATSEKSALKHYLDGRVSAVLGTHTHVMTADHEITEKGTAFISDVGMVGYAGGCIGVDKENIIKTFLTQIPYTHKIPEKGETIINAVILSIDEETGKTKSIKPIIEKINI